MKLNQLKNLTKIIGLKKLIQISKYNKDNQKYARDYMTSYCVMTLLNINFFNELGKLKKINLKEFAKTHKLNLITLNAICEYLFVVRILNRENNAYTYTRHGEDLINRSIGTFDFLYAYAPIFENLESIIKNEKTYNKDVFRRGDYVGKATAEVSQYIPIPIVKEIINRNKFKTVLDLGCGSADFLLELSNKSNLRCCGIDISIDAIRLAKSKINSSGKSNQVFVQLGDILNIKDLKNVSEGIEVITCMFVLHEFINDGREKIINFLKNLKNAFPNSALLICEFQKFSSEELRKNPVSIAEHHLFHALSNQGIFTKEECREIFKDSNYKIQEEVRFDFAGQMYFLLR